MTWLNSILAEADGPITIATILVALGAFTSALIWWILSQLKGSIDAMRAAVDRNSALTASLAEVQMVRLAESANTAEKRQVVDMLQEHLTANKK